MEVGIPLSPLSFADFFFSLKKHIIVIELSDNSGAMHAIRGTCRDYANMMDPYSPEHI